MTAFTPNFSLPYPTALDAPCDFAEQWCEFTDAVNAVTTRFQTTVDRTVPTIPMARMTLTTPITIVNGGTIPFDSVSVNTAGWIDFDASNTDIVPDRAGYFVMTAQALFQTTGVLGNVFSLQFNNFTTQQDNQIDRATSSVGLNLTSMRLVTTPFAFNVRVQRTIAGNLTINAASFSLWWHADTATP